MRKELKQKILLKQYLFALENMPSTTIVFFLVFKTK